MPSWLAWRSGERRSTARRDVDLATAVSAMPAVSDGLADGVLSKSKAAELTRASAATPEQQAALVAAATTASAEDVARRVDRWQLEHSASPPVVDEDLTVTPVPGGARVQATIDTEGAEWVQVAVDAAADRLGLRDVAGEDGGRAVSLPSPGTSSSTPMCPRREWAGPPWWSQSTWRPLRRPRAAQLGSIPAPTCQATWLDASPATPVSSACSPMLDAARPRPQDPCASPAQCRAVIHRDGHCRYEGCQAPPCDSEHECTYRLAGQTRGRLPTTARSASPTPVPSRR